MGKHGYAFGGPFGALGISVALPLLVYAFAFLCNDVTGCPAPSTLRPSSLTVNGLKNDVGWQGLSALINAKAFLGTVGYYSLSLVLNRLLPAQKVEGVELRNGGRLNYRFNALSSGLFILSIAIAGTIAQGAEFGLWRFINDNYVPILTSNLIIAVVLATFVYVRSFSVKPGNAQQRELAQGGYSGNVVYDWFIGRELNPRVTIPGIGEIDIKSWCEIRPGLLGWILLDLAFAARQYHEHRVVTDSMVMTVFSQALYVLDCLYMEPAILTTIDITTDGFGFMLAFGDLAWLPFIYSMQARYLAVHPVRLGPAGVVGILAVQGLGYYIFRASNNEKNRFRTNPKDPKVAHLKYLKTKSGSKLLVSGWWGRARHINYLGDWLMSWAYCLPTGIAGYIVHRQGGSAAGVVMPDSDPLMVEVRSGEARGWGMIFTYFFMLYFAILLIHRERRDDEKCRLKYGKDWEEYCKRVPSRIIPGVY